jgi:hypothetical protein
VPFHWTRYFLPACSFLPFPTGSLPRLTRVSVTEVPFMLL